MIECPHPVRPSVRTRLRRLAVVATIGLGVSACQTADGADTSPETTLTPVVATVSTLAQQATTTAAPPTTSPPTTVATIVEAPTTIPETTTTVAETTTIVAPSTTAAPQVPMLEVPLQAVGTEDGTETARMQQRLLDLGFWLSAVDGDFGTTTKQAVMAFQKWSGLSRTGALDQVTADFLNATTVRVQARTTSGSLAEIDKDRQLLFLIRDGVTVWALNASSGSGQYYLEENQKKPGTWEAGRSVTPSGEFKVNRERPEGWWEGDLGKIYRPKYFNGGIAIHGSGSIPAQPASHGCVRVSTPAMDMIWDEELVPKGTTVVVYGNDVEASGPPPTLPPAPPPTPAPDPTVPVDTSVAPPVETSVAPPAETPPTTPVEASVAPPGA